MRSVLICDRGFGAREHSLLRRLEVGLVDEGIRVTRAAPEGHAPMLAGGFSATVGYADTGSRLTRRLRSAALVRRLTTGAGPLSETIAELPVDIVHALGEGAWDHALDVASMTGAALVLEVWSGRLLPRLREFERHAGRFIADGGKLLWLAPDGAIARAMQAVGVGRPVAEAAWGVHVPDRPEGDRPDTAPTSIGVVAHTEINPGSMRALLDALAERSRTAGDMLVFIDHAIAEANPWLWRRADDLGLLDTVSVIADLESQRDLVLHADALVLPDPAGDHRSIVLDAMAAGMAVISAADPLIDDLIDGRTAVIADEPTAAGWSAALRRGLDDPGARAALSRSAREHIRAHRLAHAHVMAVLGAYQSVVESPIAFPPAG